MLLATKALQPRSSKRNLIDRGNWLQPLHKHALHQRIPAMIFWYIYNKLNAAQKTKIASRYLMTRILGYFTLTIGIF